MVHDVFQSAHMLFQQESSFNRTDLQCRCQELLDTYEKDVLSFLDASLATDLAALWHFSKDTQSTLFHEKWESLKNRLSTSKDVVFQQQTVCHYWLFLVDFTRWCDADNELVISSPLLTAYQSYQSGFDVSSICFCLKGFRFFFSFSCNNFGLTPTS